MIPKHINKYCNGDISQIENYEQAINDTTQTWDCHHRLETDLNLSQQELKDKDLYYNRPASELIFLTHSEHASLHNKDKFFSEEYRRKISEAGKGRQLSEEHKKKIGEARKGKPLSEEQKRKLIESHIGVAPYNKGTHLSEEQKHKISESIKHKSLDKEYIKKLSDAKKGRIFINNGQITKTIYPNELDYYISLGYIKGRLKRK